MIDIQKLLDIMVDVKNNEDCGLLDHSLKYRGYDSFVVKYEGRHNGQLFETSRTISFDQLKCDGPKLFASICRDQVREIKRYVSDK